MKFNKKIEELSTEILENGGVHRDYTDEDLSNATLIFTEVLLAKMYDKHSEKLDQKYLVKLVEEMGKSLHQTIKLFTGVDLHNIYK